MILIDTVYIHNSGGKLILDLILAFCLKNNLQDKFFFLFDYRYENKGTSKFQHLILKNSERQRLSFYQKQDFNFSKICCLANVPPPKKQKTPTSIYFHNDLILETKGISLSLKHKVLFNLKRNYIKRVTQTDYRWIVQSNLMKKKLSKKFNLKKNQVFVFPIYENDFSVIEHQNKQENFLYVSNYNPHKNFRNLILGFVKAGQKIKQNLVLNLTIESEIFLENLSDIKIPSNLKINFYGRLDKEQLNELYRSNKFLIYPSLKESFGLPLVEAIHYNCCVIAANLPYVHEIIEPSLVFDPYSVNDISDQILTALSSNRLKDSKLRIEDKLPNFINYLLSDV